ncbi:MAG TPA: hypothetical protein VHR16_00160 [Candidatus Limnocylindrales bacterium]|nr:hypothetical protein [Candidatus Limnocylindrales bacterium]
MDIMFLLERLESLIATGTGVPTTRKVLVDKDAILELIDQLRVAVPEEVHAAKRINAEGERIIENANDEAGRIAARAQEQAAYLIGEKGLTERAQAEGRQIVAEAQAAADNVRFGADAYAAEILGSLEAEVRKALAGIEKGIDVLEIRQAELREQDAEPPANVGTPASGAANARDVDDWPDVPEDEPAFLREEDAGQTVPR